MTERHRQTRIQIQQTTEEQAKRVNKTPASRIKKRGLPEKWGPDNPGPCRTEEGTDPTGAACRGIQEGNANTHHHTADGIVANPVGEHCKRHRITRKIKGWIYCGNLIKPS